MSLLPGCPDELAMTTLLILLIEIMAPVSGSGTALVAGHSGTDYTFTGNYSSGQIAINTSGTYYLTEDFNSSSSVYSIQLQGDSITLDGNGKNLTGTAGVGINVSTQIFQPVVTNFRTISGFEYGLLSVGEGLRVSDSVLSGNKWGVYTCGNNTTITKNTIYGNDVGIHAWYIYESQYGKQARITNNTIFQNTNGIRSASNHAQILDNIVYNNTNSGIIAGGVRCGSNTDPGVCGVGYYTVISRNTVCRNGGTGILSYLPDGRVLDNIVTDNQLHGIYISDSVNCSATNNTLVNNTNGLVIRYGKNQNGVFTHNKIINSSVSGIFFSYYSSDNPGNVTLYDNYLANTVNINGTASLTNYTWINPSGPTLGTNVMEGPYIAGNYWSNPVGTGWSDLQEPTASGYSTLPYEVMNESGAFDTEPLVRVAQTINSSHDAWTTLFPTGNITYPRYSNATYIVQAKPGADIVNVSVNSSRVGPVGAWTFWSITKDHTISSYGQPKPGQVHAFFTQNTTWGAIPLTVQFTNQSLGNPTMYSWDFGDGGISTEQSPTHTYTIPGTYSVTLRASNEETGGIATLYHALTATAGAVPSPAPTPVPGQITAIFSADKTTGSAPFQISFVDQSTGNPTSWFWDLGDGNSSAKQNVTHLYTTKGTYAVHLTAVNALSSGSIDKSGYISVT